MIAQYIIPIHVTVNPDHLMYRDWTQTPSAQPCFIFRESKLAAHCPFTPGAWSHRFASNVDAAQHTWMGFCRRDQRVQCNQVPGVNIGASLYTAVSCLAAVMLILLNALNAKHKCCWFNLFIGLMLCDKAYLYCLLATLTASFTSQHF